MLEDLVCRQEDNEDLWGSDDVLLETPRVRAVQAGVVLFEGVPGGALEGGSQGGVREDARGDGRERINEEFNIFSY